jgi:hypothetical protein
MKARRIFSGLRQALIIGVFLLVITPAASAASLRGQLVRVFPNGARAPAPGITVTVYNQALGRSIAVRTDQNGMYYLQLPAGPYPALFMIVETRKASSATNMLLRQCLW